MGQPQPGIAVARAPVAGYTRPVAGARCGVAPACAPQQPLLVTIQQLKAAPVPGRPLPVQIAFQGGGARLFGHLAVCEVLEQFRANGHIEIKRLAGSSAGALAAAALSCGEPVSTIRERYRSEAAKLAAELRTQGACRWPKRALRLIRVALGSSFFRIDLAQVFGRIYQPKKPTFSVRELEPRTHIYFADIRENRMRKAADDESVRQALADSCNFPFAFSGWQRRADRIDGGLTQNLPIDDLYEHQAEGEVIAISFADEHAKPGRIPIVSHVQQMFATAVGASVDRSKRILGEANVFLIETDITTFEFERAMREGFDSPYHAIKEAFTVWLNNWLRARSSTSYWVKPSNRSSNLPPALVLQIDDDIGTRPVVRVEKSITADIALLEGAGRLHKGYRTRYQAMVRVLRPTHIVKFQVDIDIADSPGQVELKCAATDLADNPKIFTVQVHRTQNQTQRSNKCEIYFCFENPLNKDQQLILRYDLLSSDIYPDATAGVEYSTVSARLAAHQSAILVVGFPASHNFLQKRVHDMKDCPDDCRRFKNYNRSRDDFIESRPGTYDEVRDFLALGEQAQRYDFVIRKVEDLPLGKAFGFMLDARQG
jgi:predicted acylesterase/phospholipase RssA